MTTAPQAPPTELFCLEEVVRSSRPDGWISDQWVWTCHLLLDSWAFYLRFIAVVNTDNPDHIWSCVLPFPSHWDGRLRKGLCCVSTLRNVSDASSRGTQRWIVGSKALLAWFTWDFLKYSMCAFSGGDTPRQLLSRSREPFLHLKLSSFKTNLYIHKLQP